MDDWETGIEDLVIESDSFKNFGGYRLRGIYSSFSKNQRSQVQTQITPELVVSKQ